MDSYGDGNTYRGTVCKDPEIKTIEISQYNADVERLVDAARHAENALLDYIPTIEKTGASLNYGKSVLNKLKSALEPFNK